MPWIGRWDDLDARDPFLVIEAGAGRGRLAADVLASEPRCSPALRYVLVERSDARRAEQRDLLALEPVEDALGPLARGRPIPTRPSSGGWVRSRRRWPSFPPFR